MRATRNQDVPYSTIKSSAQGQLETARLNFLLYVGEVRLINASKNWTRILFQCQRHWLSYHLKNYGDLGSRPRRLTPFDISIILQMIRKPNSIRMGYRPEARVI